MNKAIFLLFFLSSTGFVYSQKYMDKIIDDSCKCVSEISEDVKPENYTMELGLCMIKVSLPYKKQLKKDFDIDMDNIADSGEKLGGLIGSRMVGVCPNELILMTETTKEIKESDVNAEEEFNEKGVVVKIENNYFVIFYLKGENGKTKKYYWMSTIKTKEDLIYDYLQLEGKEVEVDYIIQSFFDPKISDYRNFQVIKELKIVN